MKNLTVLLVSLILSTVTLANPNSDIKSTIELLGGLGLTTGGDDLIKAYFDNGSSEKLKAGDLIDVKAGIIYNLDQTFSLQSTLGYHFDNIDAENGDATFSRIPLDLVGFYNNKRHRIGLGLSYHTNVELEEKLFFNNTYEFEDSVGALVEYGYRLDTGALIGLRYMNIDYTVDAVNGMQVIASEDIDGSHFGAYIYITL